MTVANVGGVFAVLISGAGCAIFVSILDMLLSVRNRAAELEVINFIKFSFILI